MRRLSILIIFICTATLLSGQSWKSYAECLPLNNIGSKCQLFQNGSNTLCLLNGWNTDQAVEFDKYGNVEFVKDEIDIPQSFINYSMSEDNLYTISNSDEITLYKFDLQLNLLEETQLNTVGSIRDFKIIANTIILTRYDGIMHLEKYDLEGNLISAVSYNGNGNGLSKLHLSTQGDIYIYRSGYGIGNNLVKYSLEFDLQFEYSIPLHLITAVHTVGDRVFFSGRNSIDEFYLAELDQLGQILDALYFEDEFIFYISDIEIINDTGWIVAPNDEEVPIGEVFKIDLNEWEIIDSYALGSNDPFDYSPTFSPFNLLRIDDDIQLGINYEGHFTLFNIDNNFAPTGLIENDCEVNLDDKASISGVVWLDENQDGERQINEDVFPGIMIECFDCNNNFLRSTHSDELGRYKFEGLSPIETFLSFNIPNDYIPTVPNNSSEETDSDVGSFNGLYTTEKFELQPGDTLSNVDLGLLNSIILSLESFTAFVKDESLIEWSSSYDLEIEYYVIQKKNGSNQFIEIGQVLGEQKGEEYTYQFNIMSASDSEDQYYRIVGITNNNSLRYSNIVVQHAIKYGIVTSIKVFPNPSNGFLNIEVGNQYSTCSISLVDNNGLIVLNNLDVIPIESPSKNIYYIELEEIPQGVYYLLVKLNDREHSVKVFIQ